jgi:hypothetical protein
MTRVHPVFGIAPALRRGATSVLALTWLLSCASDKLTDAPSTAPRGQRHRAQTEEGAAVAPAAEALAEQPVEQPAVEKPAEAAPAEKKKEEERDYSGELRAAIGSPVDCLKPRAAGPDVPTQLSIVVDATVMETGLVTRSYASSSQLDAEELKCVEQRLATLRLRAPIEAAPRSIRATIELTLQPPPQKPADAGPSGAYGRANEAAATDASAAPPAAPQP